MVDGTGNRRLPRTARPADLPILMVMGAVMLVSITAFPQGSTTGECPKDYYTVTIDAIEVIEFPSDCSVTTVTQTIFAGETVKFVNNSGKVLLVRFSGESPFPSTEFTLTVGERVCFTARTTKQLELDPAKPEGKEYPYRVELNTEEGAACAMGSPPVEQTSAQPRIIVKPSS